ncbi:MAG TPA: hypothetical protein VJG30_02300 [Candidatus Nanoarchaeia archaeon]|nr:hypothetical protein [Candidatus Nanoarchaeia archaeon]
MTLETQVESIKDREIEAFGYRGKFRVVEHSDRPSFRGKMSLLSIGDAEVGYNPNYIEEAKVLEKVVKADPFESAVTAVVRHELNHRGGGDFRGCPRNFDLHTDEVLEPVAETLQKLGYDNIFVSTDQTLYGYFANLFEDIVDNSELGNRSDMIGVALCYKENASKEKFPALFDAFIEVQEKLYGGKRSKRLLKPHRSGEKKVTEAVDNFFKRTGLDNFKRKRTNKRGKDKEIFDRDSAVNYLLNERNWKNVSTILTEEFAKLIDQKQMGDSTYLGKNFIPLVFVDTFDDELKNPETRMRIAIKKYEKARGNRIPFNPPAYMDSFEALDLVYQRLARDLEIKTRPSTTTTQMPLVGYGKRTFDPERDKIGKTKARVNAGGELELTVKAHYEHEDVEYTERMPHSPTIKFVKLDTSGSMKASVYDDRREGIVMNPSANEKQQWTDVSRYHHSLLAFYGLLELAKRQGALKHNSVLLANYSTTTQTAGNLSEAKELTLTPQFGTTNLDMGKIRDMFGKGQLVISTSDGGIENWDEIKTEYITRAKANQYFHIQMGDFSRDEKGNVVTRPQMCEDLEAAGLHVYYEDGKNLGKLVLDIARPYLSRRRINGG